jgi:DNA polymerase-3 subunit alpha
MFDSEDKYDRYWVNECVNKLEELNLIQKKEYLDELEEEADVKRIVGERLHTNMFRYPILLQHYIDMIWECGSPIGAGRGSACAALNHYLLGITQLDPLEWSFPFFRYMNRDTLELGDIDIDVAPSKRPTVLKRIKQERRFMFNDDIDYLSKQDLGCVLVATFGTESTRSVILSSCRGYRSEEFPDGIDVDTAQYLSSLIPSERGFIRSLADTVYGNKEKDWKPIKSFVNEVQKYDGLLDIMFALEGLTKSRGSHASGVILFDGDPYDYCAFMRSPKGDVTTQFDLHECEAMGMTKLDILVTDAEEKIAQTLTLLQKDGIIEKDLSLRELYNKYLHPAVLPIDDKDTWKAIQEVSVLSLFQLDSDIGRQGTKKIKPKNMIELSSTNGLIRLMQPDGWDETPMDKYIKFRNNTSLWEKEMDNYHLTEKEKEAVRRYLTDTFGIGISQEQLMKVLIDKDICGYTLAEANAARRVISKKKMNKIPELKEQIWSKATSENLAKYIWNYVAAPGLG